MGDGSGERMTLRRLCCRPRRVARVGRPQLTTAYGWGKGRARLARPGAGKRGRGAVPVRHGSAPRGRPWLHCASGRPVAPPRRRRSAGHHGHGGWLPAQTRRAEARGRVCHTLGPLPRPSELWCCPARASRGPASYGAVPLGPRAWWQRTPPGPTRPLALWKRPAEQVIVRPAGRHPGGGAHGARAARATHSGPESVAGNRPHVRWC